jgi:hypothetical protein
LRQSFFDALDGDVARVVDRRSVLVKVGEVEEDLVAHVAEELDVGVHVEFRGLLI